MLKYHHSVESLEVENIIVVEWTKSQIGWEQIKDKRTNWAANW